MRFRSLDGLRGVAALTVVFYHWMMAFDDAPVSVRALMPGEFGLASLFALPPLHLLVNGSGAVMVFYVLSGFVLSLAFERAGPDFRYWPYLTNRFLRLYPAFAASILLAVALVVVVDPERIATLSDWFDKSWLDPITAWFLAGHFLMLDVAPYDRLNNVMWSLVVELRISLIMPFLYLAMRRRPAVTLVLAALLSVGAHAASMLSPPLAASWWSTARFIVLFAAGAGLAIHRDYLGARIGALRGWPLAWVIAAVVLLYGIADHRAARLYQLAVPAVLITALAFAQPRLRALLELPLCLYLGRISYSLYLVHLPVILAVLYGLHDDLPLWALFGIAVAGSFVLAELLYRLVERPSHLLARWIAARLAQPAPAATTARA